MKTVINASPAMKALIDAQLQKRSIWPWASRKTANVDKYRLLADDKTQRISGRITVDGREKPLGRGLKQKLSEAHFYDRRPNIWAQSAGAVDMTFARPAPKAPVRRPPVMPRQGISGLFTMQPALRKESIARPLVTSAPPPAGAFESPRKLTRPVDHLGVPLTRQSQAWATITQHLVDVAFARHSDESAPSFKAPSLNVTIPHIDDAWGAELSARFVPGVRQIQKRQADALTTQVKRHKSYVAHLFNSADEAIALTTLVSAPPLMPKKSILRKPTSETRRLGEQLAYYPVYMAVSAG